MTNIEPIVRIFTACSYSFHVNLKGISHEESLKVPLPGMNCANWVAGHIVKYKYDVLEALGVDKPAEDFSRYDRQKTFVPEDAASIEELVTLSRELSDTIVDKLKQREWSETGEDVEVLTRISFWGFHESYHVGQLGMLRKALGKDGAIQ